MKHKLYYAPCARQDLADLRDYISTHLSNPTAAKATVERIMDSIQKLKDFPEMGAPLHLAETAGEAASAYRFLVCGKYLVFYRTAEYAVYVDRILYGRRHWLRLLLESLAPPGRESP